MRIVHLLALTLLVLHCYAQPPSMRPKKSGSNGSAVTSLDVYNFHAEVSNANEAWLVKISSSMCGTCQQFAPTWASVVQTFGAQINMGTIEMDSADAMKLAQQLGVLSKGVPQLVFYGDVNDVNAKTLMAGQALGHSDVSAMLHDELQALEKAASGKALKAGAGARDAEL